MANEGAEMVAGFLLGAATGIAAAILLAPQSGAETRQQIKNEGVELKAKADEAGARGRIAVEERIAALEAAVDEGKKSAERTRMELRGKLEQARSAPPPEELNKG
jgi:gas vesicle protein